VRGHLRRRSFLAGGAVAAGVVGFAGLKGVPYWLSDYATGTGEQRTVTLPDGSAISLDADSAIATAYDDQFRRIRLLHGRAFFDVAKDPARPFIVEAADGSVTALGTRFVVHEWADTVTVSVEESAVSVVAPDRTHAVLKAGENVSYARQGIGKVEGGDVEAALAWRRGKLIFEDRPLRQVIADVNRYRTGTIRLLDARLLDLRVSGIFDIRNPNGVLDAITSGLPVKSLQLSPYLVLLRPA
jgi:transmembrane sensor